jgi:hypothetical protein
MDRTIGSDGPSSALADDHPQKPRIVSGQEQALVHLDVVHTRDYRERPRAVKPRDGRLTTQISLVVMLGDDLERGLLQRVG